MGLSTKGANDSGQKNPQVFDKKAKIAQLREKHDHLLELEGVGAKAKFIPKMAYIPGVGKERCIALFPSEFGNGEDIYTEFVSAEYEPEDTERRLWKWVYNPKWETKYEKTAPHPATGHFRYMIPVEELIDVQSLHAEPTPTELTLNLSDLPPLPDASTDSPINQLTIRDKCAIDWKLPVSHKPWLNDLIKENFEQK